MSQLRPALTLLILLTLLTGVAYPLFTTQMGQWFFQQKAQGSLIGRDNQLTGSALIGQYFSRADYFWGRPSATADAPYNALASSGSNLAASNPALDDAVRQRVAQLRAANPQSKGAVPVDLITASASGLDPQISPAAAIWQAPRVAAARQLRVAQVEALIADNTTRPLLPFLGEPAVNVLQLNLALDALKNEYR